MTSDVDRRPRSHVNSSNTSRRILSNFARISSAFSESRTRNSYGKLVRRVCQYILNRSSQAAPRTPSNFSRSAPRSRMLRFPPAVSGSIPSPFMWWTRLSRPCSREMYTPFRPRSALLKRAVNATEDFIVPGAPASRTTLPFGIPPDRRSASSPSMCVRSSSMAHPLRDSGEEGLQPPPLLLHVRTARGDVERGPERRDCGLRCLCEAGDVLRPEVLGGLPEPLEFHLEEVIARPAEDLDERGAHLLADPLEVPRPGCCSEALRRLSSFPVLRRRHDERLAAGRFAIGRPRALRRPQKRHPPKRVEASQHAIRSTPPVRGEGLVAGRVRKALEGIAKERLHGREVLVREVLDTPVL